MASVRHSSVLASSKIRLNLFTDNFLQLKVELMSSKFGERRWSSTSFSCRHALAVSLQLAGTFGKFGHTDGTAELRSQRFLRTWVAFGRFFEIFVLDRSIRFENPINERNKVRNSMMASKLQHGALQDDCISKTLEFFFTFSPSTLRLLHVLLWFCYCSCCPSVMFGPIWEIWNVNKSQPARPYSRRPRYGTTKAPERDRRRFRGFDIAIVGTSSTLSCS